MCPGLTGKRGHDRPNRRNRRLPPQSGSLPGPPTNRRPVGDTGAWGKPENSGRQAVLQDFGSSLCYMGTLSPNPWDLSRWGNNGPLTCREVSAPLCLPLVGHELMRGGTDITRPAIAAAESALRSRPRGALSSAQLQSVSPNHVTTSRNIQRTASV